jgi:hypothetical protein
MVHEVFRIDRWVEGFWPQLKASTCPNRILSCALVAGVFQVYGSLLYADLPLGGVRDVVAPAKRQPVVTPGTDLTGAQSSLRRHLAKIRFLFSSRRRACEPNCRDSQKQAQSHDYLLHEVSPIADIAGMAHG